MTTIINPWETPFVATHHLWYPGKRYVTPVAKSGEYWIGEINWSSKDAHYDGYKVYVEYEHGVRYTDDDDGYNVVGYIHPICCTCTDKKQLQALRYLEDYNHIKGLIHQIEHSFEKNKLPSYYPHLLEALEDAENCVKYYNSKQVSELLYKNTF